MPTPLALFRHAAALAAILALFAATSLPAPAQQPASPAEQEAEAEADPGPSGERVIIPRYEAGGNSESATRRNRQAVRFVAARDDPPFVFERRGLALGLYVDFVREMCDVMNLACVIDLIPRDELIDEPLGDRDVLIASIADAGELSGRYDFTQPILQNTGRILVRGDSPLTRGWQEDLAGIRLGVVNDGGPEARFVAEVLELEPAALFSDLREALDSLEAGAVDALFADGLRLNFFLASPQGSCCRLLPGAYTDPDYFTEFSLMAVRQNNAAMRQLMASGIDSLTRNEARWGQVYLKYFPFGLY